MRALRAVGPDVTSRCAFYAAIAVLRPAVICDVGSCDGAEAIRFKRRRQASHVIAFEANRANFDSMAADPRLAKSGVEVRHCAASNTTGTTTFYEVDPASEAPWAKGTSSLRLRGDLIAAGLVQRPVGVPSVRLDEALGSTPGRIALWVDVEGAAGQVVEGLRGIAERICVLHIEVEQEELWAGQTAAAEVLVNLSAMGFRELSRQRLWDLQDDVVLVRHGQGATYRATIAAIRVAARACAAAQAGRRWGLSLRSWRRRVRP